GAVGPKHRAPPPGGVRAPERPSDRDPPPRTAPPAALLGDPQDKPIERDGVVPGHDALFFVAEDLVEIVSADGHEGRRGIRGRPAEPSVVAGDEVLAQIAIGGGYGPDPGDAEFVDEAILQRAADHLAAPPRLRGIAGDVLDPELLDGARE